MKKDNWTSLKKKKKYMPSKPFRKHPICLVYNNTRRKFSEIKLSPTNQECGLHFTQHLLFFRQNKNDGKADIPSILGTLLQTFRLHGMFQGVFKTYLID